MKVPAVRVTADGVEVEAIEVGEPQVYNTIEEIEMLERWMSTRKIFEHMINECNEHLSIEAMGEPGPGGANHRYRMIVGNGRKDQVLQFQNGGIEEVGTNGVTHEALLVIVLDRMRAFQEGPYSCRENAMVITKLDEALMWLHKRTRDRVERGVEGKVEP